MRPGRSTRLRTAPSASEPRKDSPMPGTRVFISFDFDPDEHLKSLLIGQSREPDSTCEVVDRSVKGPLDGNWEERARRRIRSVDRVVVICGEWTHTARGVAAELT